MPCREVAGAEPKQKVKSPYGDCVPNAAASATTDRKTIKRWWREHPKALPGLATGDRFDVIDVDVKDDRPGMQTFKEIDDAGLVAETRCYVDTPSGGQHIWVPASGDKILTDPKDPARSRGIDYRGAGCFVIAPGAVLPDGEFWSPQDGDTLDWESVLAQLENGTPVPFVKKYKARWLGKTSKASKTGRARARDGGAAEGGALGCILEALRERSALRLHEDPSEPGHYRARCPVHGMADRPDGSEHSDSSLAVGPGGDAEYVLHCYADCDAGGVLGALGLSDLAIRHYLHAQATADAGDDEETRVEEVRAKQRVQMKGTAAARRDLATEGWAEPPDDGSLADQEADPAPEIGFLVEGLIPAEGIVQVNAQYKAGKTILVSVNLVKALAEDSPFLRRFAVNFKEADDCIAVWNMEVSARTLQNWLFRTQMGRVAKQRVFPKHLRGQHIDLQSEIGADWAVRWLRERNVKVWVLDPLSKIYHGDENSNTEFNQWWKALEQVMRRAGVRVTVLVHHSGHGTAGDGDAVPRGRGASAMMGNPDCIVSYRHGGDHGSIPPDSRRYLAAFGREIDLPEITLDYDPASGEMYVVDAVGTSGGRSSDRLSRMGIAAAKAVWQSEEDYLSKVKVERAIGKGDTNTKRDAIEWARDEGYIVVTAPEKAGLSTKISRGSVRPPGADAHGKLKIVPNTGAKSGANNGAGGD